MTGTALLRTFRAQAQRLLGLGLVCGIASLGSTALLAQGASDADLQMLTGEKLALEQRMTSTAAQLAEAQAALAKARADGNAAAEREASQQILQLRAELEQIDAESKSVEQRLGALIRAIRAPMEGLADSKIAAGESLEIYVVEDEGFNGVYQVRRGGYILMPAVGRIPVAGMELTEAEAAVKAALERTQLTTASVLVERPSRTASDGKQYIFLSGQFNKPGLTQMLAGAENTIATATITYGVNPMADQRRIRLLRLVDGRSVVEEFDVESMLRGAGLASDTRLVEGDILFAPIRETESTIYVTGRVGAPGPQEMPANESLTAYTAILRAGGLAPFANLKRVYVIREVGGGQRRQLPVDLVRVQQGLEPDVELQGRDIIVVPERFFSF